MSQSMDRAARNPINDQPSDLGNLQTPSKQTPSDPFGDLKSPVTRERILESGEGTVQTEKGSEPFKFEFRKIMDDVTSLAVEAASHSVKFVSSIGLGVRQLLKNPATTVAIAGIGMAEMTEQAKGCLRYDGSNDNDYTAAAAAMQTNLLSLRIWLSDKNTHQMAVVNASATYWNSRHVITSAHNFTDVLQQYDFIRCEVGTGPNYATNRGSVTPGFAFSINPTHNTSLPGYGADIAIVHLAASVPGELPTVGTANIGEVVRHAGFGATATPSTAMINDHNSRAWDAPLDPTTQGSFLANLYGQTRFYPYIPLNGHGLRGDSGGPVYNSSGQLIGINDAQSGDTIVTGATFYLKLDTPEVMPWLVQNTSSVVPNAPTLSFAPNGKVTVTGDTNQLYGIEASTNLVNWQEIGVVTNLTGSVTFTDSDAPKFSGRFYRANAK